MICTYKAKVIQKDGKSFNVILDDVLYIPDLYINLFSLTKVLNNPAVDIKKKNNSIVIFFKHQTLFFDRNINVGKGRY